VPSPLDFGLSTFSSSSAFFTSRVFQGKKTRHSTIAILAKQKQFHSAAPAPAERSVHMVTLAT
jgi:hypothetical protein